MNKILQLLEKAGCNPALVTSIGEALEVYKKTVKESFEADYKQKIAQAKKVCVEEVEAHNRDLARRLEIFCEAKCATIEAHLARQSALRESEAQAKLCEIDALLEGSVRVNGKQNGHSTAAIEKAQRQAQKLAEERDRAVEIANRHVAIAQKALANNQRLLAENTKLKKSGAKRHLVEGRSTGANRIDSGRKPQSRPVSTRATPVENQDRRPVNTQRQPTRNVGSHGYTVSDIAAGMDQ